MVSFMRNYNGLLNNATKRHRLRVLKNKYKVKGVDTPAESSHFDRENQYGNWENAYQRNIAKITSMILLFSFSNDDDKVSRKEFKIFKKYFKLKENLLTDSDFNELKHLTATKFTLQSFIDYMYKNDYKEKIFLDAIKESRKIVKKENIYINLIEELEEKYKNYNL
jgi:hypothetical protein